MISRWIVIIIIGLSIQLWFILPLAITAFIFYKIRKNNLRRRGMIV